MTTDKLINGRPYITVAAVVEIDGRFLMVEELEEGRTVYNQPAGHVELNESLSAAVSREVLEETCLRFVPEFIIGFYLWGQYLRVAFGGQIDSRPVSGCRLDECIVAVHCLDDKQIKHRAEQGLLRSPLVLSCFEDYRRGQRYPLSMVRRVVGDP